MERQRDEGELQEEGRTEVPDHADTPAVEVLTPDLEWVLSLNREATILIGWSDCIMGMTHAGCIAYDRNKMVEKLKQRDGMSYEEAEEFIDYNVEGALNYIADYPPVLIRSCGT